MFLTVCNLILSPHPLGRSILDEARDQPIPGSFLKTLGTRLQCNLDGISQWCRTWRMNLNETKCGVLKVTRNLKPAQSSYHLNNDNSANSTVICKRLVQKDLGVLITADLKWNQQVSAVCAKANRMLGFVKRSSIKMHDRRTRTALYKTLV